MTQNIKNIARSDTARPIGIFDSGIGGLTVLKCLRQHFPLESYIYVGDTARLPYGTKSPETVKRYAESLAREILKHNVKAIVVACNTASTHGLEAVKTLAGSIPVIGMIDPAAEAAIKATKNNHIAVIATAGTIKSNAYTKALHRHNPSCRVSPVACQMLVALAEEGWAKDDIARATLHRYLDTVFMGPNQPDTLILGCTHFPLFESLLRDILGPDIALINSGEAAASVLKNVLDGTEHTSSPRTQFCVTDDPLRFAENALKFYDSSLLPHDVTLIDITG